MIGFQCNDIPSTKACLAQIYTVKGNTKANLTKMAATGVHILISCPEKDKVSGDVFISESLIDDMGSML